MTVPINTPQQTMTRQQHQHQHNLTNIMHTRNARHGYTTTDVSTHTHTSDVLFSFQTHGDRRLQNTLMRYLSPSTPSTPPAHTTPRAGIF